MKKRMYLILIFAIIVILIIIFINIYDNKNIYGTYIFDNIIYSSSLSPVTKDTLIKNMNGGKYFIYKDYFKIESTRNNFEIKNPIYKKEKMDQILIKRFENAVLDAISLSNYNNKNQVTLFNSNNEKINHKIYILDNEIWIASYHDYEKNKYGIMYLYKLRKLKPS